MENHISNRINDIIGRFKLNPSSFSKKIGLTNNVTIPRIINESRNPSFDILEKILLTFENINAEWLLLGTGEMLKSKEDLSAVTEPIENYSLKTNNEMDKIFMDLVERNLKLQNEVDRLKDELEYYRTGNSSKAKF